MTFHYILTILTVEEVLGSSVYCICRILESLGLFYEPFWRAFIA